LNDFRERQIIAQLPDDGRIHGADASRGEDTVRFEDRFVARTNIVQRAISRWDNDIQAGRRIGRLGLIFMRR
jgi:hypothetical protein